MNDLKEKTIVGGAARACALMAGLLIRVGSLMVLARLLEPRDFGLIGMVTAFTGVLNLLRDFGLSAATVQSASITEQQTSTLFWINVTAGALFTAITIGLSPLVSAFYHEPRLFSITAMVAFGFLFNGFGIQHSALLQRQMRFTALALIEIVSQIVSTALAIGLAQLGYRYWALVAMTISLPLTATIGMWLATRWLPTKPRLRSGIRSLLRFGSALTLNGLAMYAAANVDKVLLGRFWGAEAIGIYGRAYQLIRIPIDNLNSTIGEVAFSALSRVQQDPIRLKRYFLSGYSLVLMLTLPLTIACAFFADDVVLILLGPRWTAAAGIFRWLSPTILVFAILNPLGWLLNALGLVARGLKIALVLAPLMIGGCVIGLPWGPIGVAVAYATVMALAVLPVIAWVVQGTVISFWDVMHVVSRPAASVIPALGLALGARLVYGQMLSPWLRLTMEGTVLLGTYLAVLLFVAGQKSLFLSLFRGWNRQRSDDSCRATALP